MTTILPAVKPRYSRRFRVRPVTAGGEAAHPTGAPFDHRDIHENAIGMIGNELRRARAARRRRRGGRPWAFVATLDGHPVGWIYRELISYN